MKANLDKKYLEYPGYDEDEETFDNFIESLGALVKIHFSRDNYLKVRGVDLGWQRLTKTSAVTIYHGYNDDLVGRVVLARCGLDDDNHIRVYRRDGSSKGLVIVATNHDNPVNGNRYYLTPITERTFNRLR